MFQKSHSKYFLIKDHFFYDIKILIDFFSTVVMLPYYPQADQSAAYEHDQCINNTKKD